MTTMPITELEPLVIAPGSFNLELRRPVHRNSHVSSGAKIRLGR